MRCARRSMRTRSISQLPVTKRMWKSNWAYGKKRATPKPRYQPLLEMLMAQRKLQSRTPQATLRDSDAPSLKVYPPREGPRIGRNGPCPCGSGKKFKKCCMT